MNLNSGNFAEAKPRYGTEWGFKSASDLTRSVIEILIESDLKDALIRLKPEIQANLNLADEVIYKLSVILISVEKVDLVKANE
jgi:type I restriction enzyme R subunit